MIDDVSIIIRGIGERTEDFCKYIIEKQVPPNQITIINEKPFWRAVQKTFEIGIEQSRRWTLAVDADVFLAKGAVSQMIEEATTYGDQLYIYQGYVQDYIFGFAREGGPHLYQTKWLDKALDALDTGGGSLRPESDTYRKLADDLGALKVVDNKLFGFHDYYQYRFDLMRKSYVHAIKHDLLNWNKLFIENWSSMTDKVDALALFQGWVRGRVGPKSEFLSELKEFFDQLTIVEKSRLNKEEFQQLYDQLEMNESHQLKKRILPEPKLKQQSTKGNFLSKVFFKIHLISLKIANLLK